MVVVDTVPLEIMKAEQEEPDIPTSKPIESTGWWLQQLFNGLNQGDSEQTLESARQEYAAYRKSQHIALVDEAFKHCMKASRGVRHREWILLRGCTSAALVHYWRNGKTLQDLERLVCMGNEFMGSWTNTMESPEFGVRIAYVIAQANKDIYLQSIKKENGIGKAIGDEQAFKRAQHHFTKVIDNDRVGNLSCVARTELSILIVRRCRHKKVVQGLDVAIPQLEHTLKEASQPEQTLLTSLDTLRITGHLMLAYFSLYLSRARNRIAYPFTRGGRLRNVNSALFYLERTRTQSEQMKSTKVGPARLQHILGTLLFIRGFETKKLSDVVEAKTALETTCGMDVEGLDEGFISGAERLLSIIDTSEVVFNFN